MSNIELGIRKKICKLCPFSRTKTLSLHPDRAEEFAYMAENPYNNFVCHETGVTVDDGSDRDGDIIFGPKSLTCCGFASMQANLEGHVPEGVEIDPDAFGDIDEMIEKHYELWER